MEQLLHYVWKHKIFPLKELKTTTGQQVEVIDTGLANTDAGPDFFNAKLKLDGVLWIGNIEIHERSSDWFKHGHHADAGYNSVILHIASEIDTEISRSNGERIPQIQLICPEGKPMSPGFESVSVQPETEITCQCDKKSIFPIALTTF